LPGLAGALNSCVCFFQASKVQRIWGAKLAAVASPTPPSPPSKKMISLVSVSSQDEGEEVCNFTVEKASKLSEAERQEIRWKSPDEWEFENETLAESCKKLNLCCPF
jgi:hypothetical protein